MADRPNLIFLMPDQLRADFLSCYDAAFIDTPHIDSLVERGVLFSSAYSQHPVCVPARVALMTGMDALSTGVLDNGHFLRPDYADCGIKCLPEILRDEGYYTAAIGKMHFYPWDLRLGFQYRSIAEDKRWIYIRDDYYAYLHSAGYDKYHGKEHEGYYEHRGAIINKLPWEYTVDHFVGMESCRFIKEHGDEGPFMMMVGFPGPHGPYDPAPEFLDDIDEGEMPPAIPSVPGDADQMVESNVASNLRPWNGVDYGNMSPAQKAKIRAHYAASVKQIDYEVGQILDSLRDKNLLDNTIIIFSSDHGDYLGDHDLMGKGTFYETGCHVPMLVSLPGADGSQTRSELVALTDVTATLLAMAGCDLPEYMDSRVMPGLGIETEPREMLISSTFGGWSIYDGQWRLSKYENGESMLYNLRTDPHEQVNLLNEPKHCEVRDRLDRALTRYVMGHMRTGAYDRLVYQHELSQTTRFGREGWKRPYPMPMFEDEYTFQA